MSNTPTITNEERRNEPSPSLRGLYQDPDGTHETGNKNIEEETERPASAMNSGVDPFRRDDLLEPPAPEASQSNPIQPKD